MERSLQTIFTAPDIEARVQAIRALFVEILDYDYADQRVSLGSANNDQLPDEAYIVARRDGVSAVYVPLDEAGSNRVTGAVSSAAARVIGNVLADDSLLLFTNRDGDQLHIIKPDLAGSRPRLQRIVAHRGRRERTVGDDLAPRPIRPAQFVSAAECLPGTPPQPLPGNTNRRVNAASELFQQDLSRILGSNRRRTAGNLRNRQFIRRQLNGVPEELATLQRVDTLRTRVHRGPADGGGKRDFRTEAAEPRRARAGAAAGTFAGTLPS